MEAAKIGPDLELGQVSQTRAVIETCLHEEIHRRTPYSARIRGPLPYSNTFNIPRFSRTM